MPETVTIILTAAQYRLLCEVLREYDDEGPDGEGWQSGELVALSNYIESAVRTNE